MAFQRRLDFFGVLVLANVTAIGGGIVRDIILGNTPPVSFIKPIYAIVSIITAIIMFFLLNRYREYTKGRYYHLLSMFFTLCDAIGLGVFTVVGINTALMHNFDKQWFLLIFVGMITGVGGGMIRDILAVRIPLVLRREIYAVASILGALLYCVLINILPISRIWNMLISTLFVVLVRLISAYRDLHLPVLDFYNSEQIESEETQNNDENC